MRKKYGIRTTQSDVLAKIVGTENDLNLVNMKNLAVINYFLMTLVGGN